MTTIYTVRDNLQNTIAGKEKVLADYRETQKAATGNDDIITYAMIRFLETNLEELYKILADVQVCCNQATDVSWQLYPDRMGQ